MSAERSHARERSARRWLHAYPASWRARYGEELADLILATSGQGAAGGIGWRTRIDLLRSGAVERAAGFGLGGRGVPPRARARAGALLTLCAAAIFLIGAAVVQRFGENWQALEGDASVNAAGAAVEAMKVIAPIAAIAILLGIGLATPYALGLLRGGRWRDVRKPLRRAVELSVAAAFSLALVAFWAHHLSASQRNGQDVAYEIGFSAMAVVYIACLAAWAISAIAIAIRLELPSRLLRFEAWMASVAAAAMLALDAALAVWWGTLATSAPWALHGLHPGDPASAVSPPLLLGGAVMTVATGLALTGAMIAMRARTELVAER